MAGGESIPRLCDGSDSSGSDDDDFDWQECDTEDGEATYVECLFCPQVYGTVIEAISHCCTDHNFDLVKLKSRFNMDCYSYIKLVNYIHVHHPNATTLMNTSEAVWEQEEYMKPAKIDDPWLMYDFDDTEVPSPIMPGNSNTSGFHVNAEDGLVTLSEQHFAELQQTIQRLASQVREKDAELKMLLENMKTMRHVTQALVESGDVSENICLATRGIKNVKLEEDEGYFNTYSHFSIHHEMLSDNVRTSSYRDALFHNSELWKGKTVLDLGCGTGILSMFASSAGAHKVIGVDQSEIIYHAMDIIRENKLEDTIQLLKGRIEDIELSQKKVDVIVSEWMGYFLLFEGMLDSVIYARNHHLAEGGLLLPNRCSISMAGLGDTVRHSALVGFWTDVYGYRMTSLRNEVVKEATIEVVPEDKIITSSCLLTELNLNTCSTSDMDFSSELKLEVMKDGSITALVGYFDVFFDLPHPVSFSTSPQSQSTHWKQTVFLLEEPVGVKQGDILTGKVICQFQRKDVRALNVTITLCERKQKFILS